MSHSAETGTVENSRHLEIAVFFNIGCTRGSVIEYWCLSPTSETLIALAWVVWVPGFSKLLWKRGVTVQPGWEPLLPESEERRPQPRLAGAGLCPRAEEGCVVCVRGYL